MSLWVDKYRPNNLQKLDFHCKQANHLRNLVRINPRKNIVEKFWVYVAAFSGALCGGVRQDREDCSMSSM
jgi:hypothetical protein